MPRDIYKYHLKKGNRILKSGITNDLERREREHQRKLLEMTSISNRLEGELHARLQENGKRTKKKCTPFEDLCGPGFTDFNVMIGTFFVVADF